ncbi:Hypothetical predicted protein [Octopus vulgaris]|uniref:Uncharacterized protein n=1 Tax=Octopus vulgaris TaxID=6645 RepID=A0AA36B061_OCTVU|nr:Hypothetical predicted protein [Octopus vulgaris]
MQQRQQQQQRQNLQEAPVMTSIYIHSSRVELNKDKRDGIQVAVHEYHKIKNPVFMNRSSAIRRKVHAKEDRD